MLKKYFNIKKGEKFNTDPGIVPAESSHQTMPLGLLGKPGIKTEFTDIYTRVCHILFSIY